MPDTLDVERRVRDIIARLFDLSPDQANDHLRMGNPPEWDSFGHVQLLFTIEDEFGIRFPNNEMTGLVTIESIVKAVRTHNGS